MKLIFVALFSFCAKLFYFYIHLKKLLFIKNFGLLFPIRMFRKMHEMDKKRKRKNSGINSHDMIIPTSFE
jgi:hypothetical protein